MVKDGFIREPKELQIHLRHTAEHQSIWINHSFNEHLSFLCVKVGLTLNEQLSAGFHAALHPAGISLKINGVAAAREACHRGPFDPAQTPWRIDLQRAVERQPIISRAQVLSGSYTCTDVN